MEEPPSSSTPWWGTFSLEESTGGKWAIGPSTLWIYRSAGDWRIIHRPSTDPVTADPMAQRSAVTVPVPPDEMESILASEEKTLQTSRYSVRDTSESITLRPALADRPVISRPEHPLFVPPGEAVTLYLSTPLWIRVVLAESDRQLQEMPSHRMSDTWFGPSTREGELCYATRTAGRLHLEHLPVRMHRALTPLRIQNTAQDVLALERVQLPARHLALYETPDDVLWTQRVTMTRTESVAGADVQIKDGPPADADQATLLQDPCEPSKKGLLTSTFSTFGALFGA